MSRRRWVTLLLFVSFSVAPLRAQLVVIDPANLVQTILIGTSIIHGVAPRIASA